MRIFKKLVNLATCMVLVSSILLSCEEEYDCTVLEANIGDLCYDEQQNQGTVTSDCNCSFDNVQEPICDIEIVSILTECPMVGELVSNNSQSNFTLTFIDSGNQVGTVIMNDNGYTEEGAWELVYNAAVDLNILYISQFNENGNYYTLNNAWEVQTCPENFCDSIELSGQDYMFSMSLHSSCENCEEVAVCETEIASILTECPMIGELTSNSSQLNFTLTFINSGNQVGTVVMNDNGYTEEGAWELVYNAVVDLNILYISQFNENGNYYTLNNAWEVQTCPEEFCDIIELSGQDYIFSMTLHSSCESCQTFDCPNLEANTGDVCYDIQQNEGVINEDCECEVETIICQWNYIEDAFGENEHGWDYNGDNQADCDVIFNSTSIVYEGGVPVYDPESDTDGDCIPDCL